MLPEDNLSSTAGSTSSVKWSWNCGIVPNFFLHVGQPVTTTPLPPWAAIHGGSSTNVQKSCRWSSVRSARYNSDLSMALSWIGEEAGGQDSTALRLSIPE